jgi:hypothetical protein
MSGSRSGSRASTTGAGLQCAASEQQAPSKPRLAFQGLGSQAGTGLGRPQPQKRSDDPLRVAIGRSGQPLSMTQINHHQARR